MRNTLLIALFALCLTAFAGVAQADTPDCTLDILVAQDGEMTVPTEDDAELETLEQILAETPEDPQTKAIDSGICCSEGCPYVSGYGHYCGSASCPTGSTCLYYRK